jgi:triosephosphate isomerase
MREDGKRFQNMFVLVNLKAYPCDPKRIAVAAREVSEESGVRIGVVPQTAHLKTVAQTGVETWAQHVSPVAQGSHTGALLAEAAADAGATGTLLNHSERRLQLAAIDDSMAAAERAGLETCICANNPDQIRAATALRPSAVAVEPPALIGGDVSVSTADPGIVENAVAAANQVDTSVSVFCGAGVSTGADVQSAAELGAEGVLLASGVAKSETPREVLRNLVAAD